MEEKEQLIQAFKDLTLETGNFPLSTYAIAEKAGVPQENFKNHFVNLKELQRAAWQSYFYTTINTIEDSSQYAEYSVREKLLAFYFTFMEVIGSDADFVRKFKPQMGIWNYNPSCLDTLKPVFLVFVTELVEEGKATGEVAERMLFQADFAEWHWPQFMYILNFWMNDMSESSQRTDQAIEKSVNLGFDIMGANIFDSVVDFAKFAFQSLGKK